MRPLTPEECSSFGGNVEEVSIPGPRQLYRLCGSYIAGGKEFGAAEKKKNNPLGVWWFDSMLFWNMLDKVTDNSGNQAEINKLMRLLIREASAVSFDWNSFDSIYVMNIPPGVSVSAYSGIIKEQPFFSSKRMEGENNPGELLSGGLVQFVIPDVREKYSSLVTKSPRPFLIGPTGNA